MVEKLGERTELVTIDEIDKSKALTKPCHECPFTRTITQEHKGNPDPLVYIGQIYGPFSIPCHCADKDYRETEQWKKVDHTLQQCAGAAIFRANCGLSDVLPKLLHRLPPDHSLVFSTPAELVAHHLQIPLAMAEAGLRMVPPPILARMEMEVWRRKHAAGDPGVILTGVKEG